MDRPTRSNQLLNKQLEDVESVPSGNKKILSPDEINSTYRHNTDSPRRLFNHKDENDPLQPIHPFTCCNPRKRRSDLSPIRTIPEVIGTSEEIHTMLLKFMIHEVEVIGDLGAYSIAKANKLVRYGPNNSLSQRYYGSTFNYITSGYLLNHILRSESVSPNVFLCMGLCD